MPTTKLPVALFNYESGGRVRPGTYDFSKLTEAFKDVEEAPAMILLNEAKEWHLWGHNALYRAVNALSERLGRRYTGVDGVGVRGPASMPAFIFDPQVVRLDSWGDNHDTVHPDKQNLAHAHIWGRSAAKFRVLIRHGNPNSGDIREQEMREISGMRAGPPTLLGGDLNSPASGPHMPEMHWEQATDELRAKKAIRLPDGTYVADTRAVDFLLGEWDARLGGRPARELGWYALAELAHASGTPAEEAFRPTVNRGVDRGGGLLIDWMIVNEAWKDGLVPETYTVHVPPGDSPTSFPSDHRLVTATLEL
jgi:hypothetical protein